MVILLGILSVIIINLETMHTRGHSRPLAATENYWAWVAAGTAMRISHSNKETRNIYEDKAIRHCLQREHFMHNNKVFPLISGF